MTGHAPGRSMPDRLDAEWLDATRQELGADPVILEKAVRCLDLVAALRREGLDFLLKGGTALLLLLPRPGRLSIDVDIAAEVAPEVLAMVLSAVVARGAFTGYRLVERETRAGKPIPKLHYELEYEPVVYQRRGYILLDVVLEEPDYTTVTRSLATRFYTPTNPPAVRLPTVNSSLGDKLAAIAPTTTGIPWGAGKELPRAKQLFDVGRLVGAADDPGEMIEAFACSVEQESRFAETAYSALAVAEDLVNFARLVSMLDLRGAVEDDHTREVRAGVQRLASYVLGGEHYTHARAAKADAACAAFCAGLVRRGLADRRLWEAVRRVASREVERLPELLEAARPTGNFAFVHRLRRGAPEAAVYWCAYLAPEVFAGLG